MVQAATVNREKRKIALQLALVAALISATWWLRQSPVPTKVQGVAMVTIAVVVGDIGFRVSRRLIPVEILRRHGAAQTAIFAVVGTVYGLIAAFVLDHMQKLEE